MWCTIVLFRYLEYIFCYVDIVNKGQIYMLHDVLLVVKEKDISVTPTADVTKNIVVT